MFAFLLLLFLGSGCAALIYEIVWYHMLALNIGSTAVSLGTLLATYMGGLCIGSAWLPKLKRIGGHPMRTYAFLEFGVAGFGILVLALVPLVGGAYAAGAEHGLPNMLLRAVLAAICLLPPTILMGASLPAASRWLESTAEGRARVGLLYGMNTVGAVIGCLAAGFYLIRLHNVQVATFVAAALNVAVGLGGLWIARSAPHTDKEEVAGKLTPDWPVYLTIAISGAGALGAEVVWTRLLGMLLGSTVYIFAIILAVFLLGLAIGSWAGSWIARVLSDRGKARLALGWCQLLLVLGIGWTAIMIAKSLPYWPVDPGLSSSNWYTFQLDIVRCMWAVFPPTLLWGASFPLALAAAARPGEDQTRLVGGVYAANTLGAILGALSASIFLVPAIGTAATQQLLLVISVAGAWILLAPQFRQASVAAALAVSVLLTAVVVPKIETIPWEVVAFGRRVATNRGKSTLKEMIEGRNSSAVISQWEDGAMQIDVNGHVEATNEPFDMKLQRMVGHLAALTHPNPKKVLGIGFGAGVSAGTFTRYNSVRSITVWEIEPVIPPPSTKYFAKEDYDVFHNPRTRIVFDDARHFMMTSPEMFDIIASDPLDVFVKGTAALYTKEYFKAVKRHLNPGRDLHAVRPAVRERFPDGEVRTRDLLRGLPPRDGLGEQRRRPGLRHGLHGPPRPGEDRRRRRRGPAPLARIRDGRGVAARNRDADRDGPLRHVYRLCRRPGKVGRRRGAEHRPRSSSAIPGRLGHQLESRGPDLPRHAEAPSSGGPSVHRLAGSVQRLLAYIASFR
jgi:spermidine synthase